jgi:hypothetical protein
MNFFIKIFCIYFLFISFSHAQSREQFGVKLAECSAYNSHAFTIAVKIFNDNNMMAERKKIMGQSMDVATALIGKKRVEEIFIATSKLARAYQNNTESYVNFVGKHVQNCDNFFIENSNQIKKILAQ